MTYRELFALADDPAAALPCVLLLHGEEEYVKEEALRRLRPRVLAPGMESLDEFALDGQGTAQQMREACETPPFASERRLVLLRDPPFLAAARPAEEEARRAAEYLPGAPGSCLLVLYLRGTADARRRVFTAADKLGAVVPFPPFSQEEAARYLTREAQKEGKTLQRAAADALVERAGVSLTLLRGELHKLCAFTGDRPEIGLSDVEAVCVRSTQASVFRMVDELLAGRPADAYHTEAELSYADRSPVGRLALLTRAVRLSYDARALLDGGMPPRDVGAALGLSRYAADMAVQKARRRPLAYWRQALALCVAAEADIKQGRMDDDFAYALAIARLGSLGA